jgi:alpha-N-arabinofuranosidase
VRLANIAQMVNVLQAMILTKGPQMVLTPTYHVFKMFAPFQDAVYLPVDLNAPRYSLASASVPAISISAARLSGGAIAVALVNLDPNRAIPVSITLSGASAKHVAGTILTASAMDARNTFENRDAVRPAAFSGASLDGAALSLTLPAKSIVVLNLQ